MHDQARMRIYARFSLLFLTPVISSHCQHRYKVAATVKLPSIPSFFFTVTSTHMCR
jgi:hypothetical protein